MSAYIKRCVELNIKAQWTGTFATSCLICVGKSGLYSAKIERILSPIHGRQ